MVDPAVALTRYLARLVWLLRHEPSATAEHDAALRAMRDLSKDGSATIAVQEWQLLADDTQLDDAVPGVPELAGQLIAHGMTRIVVDSDAPPDDLLAVARLLAAPPPADPSPEHAAERLAALGVRGVHVVPPIRRTTGEFDTVHVAAPRGAEPGAVAHAPDGLAAGARVEELARQLARLPSDTALGDVTRALDSLVSAARDAIQEGDVDEAADAALAIMAREGRSPAGDAREAHATALKRLLRAPLLRGIVIALPHRPGRARAYERVLARAGEPGAEAVVAQMAGAPTIAERRAYFDLLRTLEAAVPQLVRLLGDPRWYVVRNAAELLGLIRAPGAEPELVSALAHADDRVRRAAALALAKLGTPTSREAVHRALADAPSPLRETAVAALTSGEGDRAVTTLIDAYDGEPDTRMRRAILMALGRVASFDAVRRLTRAGARARGGRRSTRRCPHAGSGRGAPDAAPRSGGRRPRGGAVGRDGR
ncbi:MAG: HEAT repeat domain-containing protein [Gemmatimonadaceae bacterium]